MPTRKRSTRSRPRKADALRMLEEDHARVKKLFEEFESARKDSRKQELAEQICHELRLHMRLEESIFYPRAREALESEDAEILDEAEIEHAVAKELIAQIEATSPTETRFSALVTVLREYVLHHVKEEEREMFEQVRRSELDLAALGEEMQQWKRDAEEEEQGEPSRRGAEEEGEEARVS